MKKVFNYECISIQDIENNPNVSRVFERPEPTQPSNEDDLGIDIEALVNEVYGQPEAGIHRGARSRCPHLCTAPCFHHSPSAYRPPAGRSGRKGGSDPFVGWY